MVLCVNGVGEPDEGQRAYGGLAQHISSALLIKRAGRVDGDNNLRHFTTDIDEGLSGVVEYGVKARIEAATHLERR